MADIQGYVVRGASMRCRCGSHPRRINLPVSHGSFVNQKPMLNEEDNKEDNISSFGICSGPANPSNETIHLVGEDGAVVSGKPCQPEILAKWLNTKEDALVEGKPALTTASQLICAFGGVIAFENDGQQEE